MNDRTTSTTCQTDDPLDIIVPDTSLDKARRALATCERKLDEQTTEQGKFYYRMCIKGWQRYIEALEAEQGATSPALNGDRI